MSPQTVKPVTIADGAWIAETFEATLRDAGITIATGSHLEDLTLQLYRISEDRRRPFYPGASHDVPMRYGTGLGIAELAGQIIAVRHHPAFPHLKHHLSLLNSAGSPQNRPSATFDDAANKLFELLVACWVMQLTDAVEVEQPATRTPNPDVIASFEGRRWGIACKTPYSGNPDSLFQLVAGAVTQIERAGVDAGIVFVNARNLIQHSKYWFRMPDGDTADGAQAWSTFLTGQDPYDLLLHDTQEIWNGVARARGDEVVSALFPKTGPTLPGIATWSQAAAGVILDGTPRAAIVQVASFSLVRPLLPWQTSVLDAIKSKAAGGPAASR